LTKSALPQERVIGESPVPNMLIQVFGPIVSDPHPGLQMLFCGIPAAFPTEVTLGA
jgi:hypothetical protein